MRIVFQALGMAFRDLFHRRIGMWIMAVPLFSLILWGVLGWFFWSDLLGVSRLGLQWGWVDAGVKWVIGFFRWETEMVAGILALLIILFFAYPVIIGTTYLLTSLFLLPVAWPVVCQRHGLYPKQNLRPPPGAVLIYSLKFSLVFIFLWILSLPLAVILPGAGLVIPWILSAWVNYKLFSFEILTDFLVVPNRLAIEEKYGKEFLSVGLAVGLLFYLPLLGLVASTFSALAFSHLILLLKQKDATLFSGASSPIG